MRFLFRISVFLPFSEQNRGFCSDSAREETLFPAGSTGSGFKCARGDLFSVGSAGSGFECARGDSLPRRFRGERVQVRERIPLPRRFRGERVQVRERRPLPRRFHEERVQVCESRLSSAPVPRGAGSVSAKCPETSALKQMPRDKCLERRRGNLIMSGLNRIFMTILE